MLPDGLELLTATRLFCFLGMKQGKGITPPAGGAHPAAPRIDKNKNILPSASERQRLDQQNFSIKGVAGE